MIKRAFAIAILAFVLPGCAHDAEWMHRQPAVESTIGSDPNEAPAGTVSVREAWVSISQGRHRKLSTA